MSKDQPMSLGAVLKEILARRSPMNIVGKELRIWEEWDKAVGAEIAKNARPQQLRAGILWVETKHPLWATELQYRGEAIRQKLNEAVGEELVKEIRARVGRF
jgi:predicted nucleic acid-binding Zn ribbon protein